MWGVNPVLVKIPVHHPQDHHFNFLHVFSSAFICRLTWKQPNGSNKPIGTRPSRTAWLTVVIDCGYSQPLNSLSKVMIRIGN